MKIAVTYDKDGNILTLFNPAEMISEEGSLTYIPAEDERHEIIDVPKEFEDKPITELPNLLRVITKLEAKG